MLALFKETLIQDVTKAIALPQNRQACNLVDWVFGRAARKCAELGIGLDRVVAEQGLAEGARWTLPHFVKQYTARGYENIPADGSLLIISNHPGSIDSMVISSHVTCPDYKIIVGDIPFFEDLPHVNPHAIYAPGSDNTHGRMQVVRAAVRHLAKGGALLNFARGGIEPNPEFMPEPDAEFNLWSRNLKIFLEHVPQTRVMTAVVSGVIVQAAMSHPIIWLRKARPDRQGLAFMIQMVQLALSGKEKFGLAPRVSFGKPIGIHKSSSAEQAMHCKIESAQSLLHSHLSWQISNPH
jgi:hypothetical protein